MSAHKQWVNYCEVRYCRSIPAVCLRMSSVITVGFLAGSIKHAQSSVLLLTEGWSDDLWISFSELYQDISRPDLCADEAESAVAAAAAAAVCQQDPDLCPRQGPLTASWKSRRSCTFSTAHHSKSEQKAKQLVISKSHFQTVFSQFKNQWKSLLPSK